MDNLKRFDFRHDLAFDLGYGINANPTRLCPHVLVRNDTNELVAEVKNQELVIALAAVWGERLKLAALRDTEVKDQRGSTSCTLLGGKCDCAPNVCNYTPVAPAVQVAGSVGDDPTFKLALSKYNIGESTEGEFIKVIDSLRAPRSVEDYRAPEQIIDDVSELVGTSLFDEVRAEDLVVAFRQILGYPLARSASVQGAEISRDVAYQALSALGHAMTICDGVPTKAHQLDEDSALKYLGLMVNYQEGTGHHGYRMIQDALAALGKELSRTEAATSAPAPTDEAEMLRETWGATEIHYPEHWDTAAYPTLNSALDAVFHSFKCSECAPEPAAERDAALDEAMELCFSSAKLYADSVLEMGIDPETKNVRKILRDECNSLGFAIRALKSAPSPLGVPPDQTSQHWLERLPRPITQCTAAEIVTASDAANFIDKRAEEYARENTSSELDTGSVIWHFGDAGRDYHSTLVELAEEIRAASASPGSAGSTQQQIARIRRLIVAHGSLVHAHWPLAPMVALEQVMDAVEELAAAPVLPQAQPRDEPTERESLIACLEDDAAKLMDENPDDEMAQTMRDAARMLEADAAVIPQAAPGAVQGWVSVEDRLPDDETPVLICLNGLPCIGELRWETPNYEETFKRFQYWDNPHDDGQAWEWHDISHWMPLPALPANGAETPAQGGQQ